MMRKKHYFLFLPKLLVYGIYQISGLMPRRQDKWVFGSHLGFADNSKFLLIDVKEHHREIRPIWIAHKGKDIERVRRLGFECHHWLSVRGLWHAFTAGVYVGTQNTMEINRFASKGAIFVNLNHGVGVKKCYWLLPKNIANESGLTVEQAKKSFMFKVVTYPWLFRGPDICLVTSEFQAKTFFAPMFNIPLSNCVYGSYPRHKLLMMEKETLKEMACRYEPESTLRFIADIERYVKVYIYMPTWRRDGNRTDCNDFVASSGIDFGKLNEVLKNRNELFVLKFHPFTKLNLNEFRGYSNIRVFDGQMDVYYILPFTDCLITDYSSIYSDYSLMNKEIILFVFDFDSFTKRSKDGLKDYDKYYPGVRANNFKELLHLIESGADSHVSKADHDFIMETYWGRISDNTDIVSEIKKRLV